MEGKKETATTEQLNALGETLIIPLYCRAVETKKSNPRLIDNKAVELVDSIQYDYSKFKTSFMVQDGCIARSIIFDRETKKFIEKNPKCIIISIGCGLDTRFDRVDNGQLTWYELDFPEVIDLRRKFFTETERHKMIGMSALDDKWPEQVPHQPTDPVMVIAEGVLLYFSHDEIIHFINIIKENFHQAVMMLDILSPFLAKHRKDQATMKKMEADMSSAGYESGKDLEQYVPGLKFDYESNISDEMSWYLGWFCRFGNDRLSTFHFE